MRRLLDLGKEYYQLCLAVLTLVAGLILQFSGLHTASHWVLGLVSLALTVPLLTSMWEDVRTGKYGIDILAATAIITSVLLHQYWAAIVIVIMLTGGETLEAYAEHRARRELDALLARAPTQAHIIRGRKTFDVQASEVRAGDKIIIRPGELVPVDAEIIEGRGDFDESSLTGESLPQALKPHDKLLSGTINIDGVITAKALSSAAESQYEQIIKLVRSAAASQAPFVRLADRYSVPFTITAYIIAFAAWFLGHQAIRFLEVIVVATPCPLLLAAPIALISGMARASKYGIIVKTGSALEKLSEAETFAFDKTGTLTRGELEVDTVLTFGSFKKTEILGLAASLEQNSNHVLAKAITTAAQAKKVAITKAKHVNESAGHGLTAMLHGKEISIGRLSFLQSRGVHIPANFKATSTTQTAACVAVGGQLAGVITFRDELRPEAKTMLSKLQKLGIEHTLMVTGDNAATAKAIAKQLGITDVQADALPGDKLRAIEAIQQRPVVFVGDGVNDAPVLTAADVGIALGARGSTAASESADIVILQDDISYVVRALATARRTFSIAQQSILIGICMSVVLMVVFSTGHFSPLLGAILQELVDVFVIFNALRAHIGPKREL